MFKKYSWNPDIGQMWCPYCGKKGILGLDELSRKIFKRGSEKEDKYLNNYDIFILMRWLKWLAHF